MSKLTVKAYSHSINLPLPLLLVCYKTGCAQQEGALRFFLEKIWKFRIFGVSLQHELKTTTMMGYSNHDKLEWTLILALEFGRRFGLTLKQSFNYLSHFKGIDFIDRHYDYCHTQSFQSMVNDIAEYCHRKGGALV